MFDGLASAVGGVFSSAINAFCDGVSLVVDSIGKAVKGIAEGIKGICDAIGTEGILLLGSIALSLIIPGFGLPEILTLIQIVGEVAKVLNIGGEDSPEELGMKMELADVRPDDFDSTEAYINHLNKEVKLDKDAVDNLSVEERAKYGLMGASTEIKAIQEKYNVELSADFLRDMTILRNHGAESNVGEFVKGFVEKGISKMQDMTDYLRGNPITTDKSDVSSSMIGTMKQLYPEMSDNQIENKISNMTDILDQYEK